MKPYTINFSQKEAGFKTTITENVLRVQMNDVTYQLCDKLKKRFSYRGRRGSYFSRYSCKVDDETASVIFRNGKV